MLHKNVDYSYLAAWKARASMPISEYACSSPLFYYYWIFYLFGEFSLCWNFEYFYPRNDLIGQRNIDFIRHLYWRNCSEMRIASADRQRCWISNNNERQPSTMFLGPLVCSAGNVVLFSVDGYCCWRLPKISFQIRRMLSAFSWSDRKCFLCVGYFDIGLSRN